MIPVKMSPIIKLYPYYLDIDEMFKFYDTGKCPCCLKDLEVIFNNYACIKCKNKFNFWSMDKEEIVLFINELNKTRNRELVIKYLLETA